uniref:Uncharacterized protein n=1 Tax=Pfiesteria piscicida TaxID=71001 RepID=A3E3S1_PFIPI|nr:unknown [Pfiesteria piscicida]
MWSFRCGLVACACSFVGSVSVPALGTALRGGIRQGFPNAASLVGAEPAGEYERKTQAPIIWFDLRKSVLPGEFVPDWTRRAVDENDFA